MERSIIGKSNLEIAALGVGCWAYGGGAYWGAMAQKDVDACVRAALDQGINYFDTAEVYNDGESERSLGIALKGLRDRAVIGSKVSTSNVRPDRLIRHCEDSLRRLGTDYIDIYMLHWPVNPRAIAHFSSDADALTDIPSVAEVFGTLQRLKEQGKIREIGVSNHGVRQMQEVLATGVEIAVNELPYNLISRAIEGEILPFCREHGIGVLGYMAYQQGILTGTYDDIGQIPPSQAHSRHFHYSRGGEQSRHGEEGVEEELQVLMRQLKELAASLGCSVAEISLAFAMQREGISCTLVGSRTVQHLQANIAAAERKLPPETIRLLETYSKPIWDKLGESPDYYENRINSRVW